MAAQAGHEKKSPNVGEHTEQHALIRLECEW